jgi:hypothetical protein
MVSLHFDPAKFPRTISRAEWREIWRWKRSTEKKLADEARRQVADLVAFGSTMLPGVRAELIDNLVRPPLLVHDRMGVRP